MFPRLMDSGLKKREEMFSPGLKYRFCNAELENKINNKPIK